MKKRINRRPLRSIWEAKFGDDWTKRNYMFRAKLREPFWAGFLRYIPDAKSILEIGCNVGMNLHAIYNANPCLKITGMEPNEYAYQESKKVSRGRWSLIKGGLFSYTLDKKADLVFTCTLLIHLHPDNIVKALKKIYRMSNKYILSMEYYWPWPKVKEVEYRGLSGALWKRDFGALWLKRADLEIIETGYVGEVDGFDRTTWWLLKKKMSG